MISLLFWALSYSRSGNVADSIIYKIGTFIEPVTRIFDLGWRTFLGFPSSAFSVATDNAVLVQAMTALVSPAEALAFMCACTFNIPCVMALSTTYRESHSLKWTAKIAGFYVASALLLSFVVYHMAVLFI